MPAGNVTVTATGDTGAGQQMTAQTLSNVSAMNFRFKDGAVDIIQEEPPRMLTVQYSNLTGVTFTPASRTVSFTDA
jgi:hypothetical protein